MVTQWDELAQFSPEQDAAITIGVFDGVHLGHRHLVEHLRQQAQAMDCLAGIVTFRQHPQQVLAQSEVSYLIPLDERIALLQELGVDFVVPLSFTRDLAQTSAREFVLALQRYLRMKSLIIGPDFALGKGREGNASVLFGLGREMNFSVHVVPPKLLDGEIVSSTAIRQALAQGDLVKVQRMLGRPYTLWGPVVHGAERGRTLGFPTANLDVNSNRRLPADGVYVTRAYVDDEEYPSVTNIGIRPTFGQQDRTIEVYLLDTDMKLYGRELRIEVLERLRGEQRFASAQELTAQMERDVLRAREILRGEG